VNSFEKVFSLFQQWVGSANRKYREKLANEARRKKRQALEQLAREQKAAEERVQVLDRLRQIKPA
jgi:DNA-binding transcriptional regulator YbjK